MRRALILLFALGFGLSSSAAFAKGGGGAPPVDLPFDVTEDRERCDHYDALKQPFFGTQHNHTGLSFDATIRLVQPRPADSYRFMKRRGPLQGVIRGVSQFGVQTRSYQIDRPLDWGAVTDHSELFGEIGICLSDDETQRGYFSLECQMLRNFYYQPVSFPIPEALRVYATAAFTVLVSPSLGPSTRNTRLPLCVDARGVTRQCLNAELSVWQEMQQAAEDAYDRSSKCEFTSFVGYENTSTPSGNNWHRNVLFRNEKVIERPITAIDMAFRPNRRPQEDPPLYLTTPFFPNPRKLWRGLEEQCIEGIPGCDALTIPHNSNLGGSFAGIPPLFFEPLGLTPRQRARRAKLRAEWEPLAEIFQDKGGSECRYDPRFRPKNPRKGWKAQTGLNPDDVDNPGEPDELCAFEILDGRTVLEASAVANVDFGTIEPTDFTPKAYLRNVLKDGLRFAEENRGVNPFQFGVGASSDNHNAIGGWHPEDPYSSKEKGPLSTPWQGHLGVEDAALGRTRGTVQSNSGGHWVVWAEENSRDSIFTGLRNKETYGTSGPRHIVRFFGGYDLPENLCDRDYVPIGYRRGVPMGGELYGEDRPRRATPTFILAADYDDHVGTRLQQIQIVKGWVEENRRGQLETHEAVYTMQGGPNGASVTDDCRPRRGRPGTNYKHMCAVWEDPDFDPDQRAFYYGRVIENPVCRVSTHICQQEFGVNPLDGKETCDEQRERFNPDNPNTTIADELRYQNSTECCNNETTDVFLQNTIQERSWTSPIWYTP